ncbi:MAG: hypothetical protein RSB67_00755 [Clostridia bacterium]
MTSDGKIKVPLMLLKKSNCNFCEIAIYHNIDAKRFEFKEVCKTTQKPCAIIHLDESGYFVVPNSILELLKHKTRPNLGFFLIQNTLYMEEY